MPGTSDTRRLVDALDEDDEILGTEGSFVPAFRPQDHHADEQCLMERQQDEVVLVSNEPESGRLFTYLVFYLLGIGTMTPWNFFVTAEDVSLTSGNFRTRILVNLTELRTYQFQTAEQLGQAQF